MTGVRVTDGPMTAIRLWNKGGARWVEALVIVDASGDADVVRAGRRRPRRAAEQGNGPVAVDPVQGGQRRRRAAASVSKAELWRRMREAAESGDYALPRIEGSWHRTPFPGVVLVHMTRIPNVDATDPQQLTRAEVAGRRQVREYARFLRERVPGFEKAVIVATSPAIGVRESRRVHGDYVLTRDDVLGGTPLRRRDRPVWRTDRGPRRRGRHGLAVRRRVRRVRHPVPVPAGPRGSRACWWLADAFSATHDAHASARSMATCMAMGQAAGTAAVCAAATGSMPRAMPWTPPATAARRRGGAGSRGDPGRLDEPPTRSAPDRWRTAIRRHRLIVVLRRVDAADALLDLVGELADTGVRAFEITSTPRRRSRPGRRPAAPLDPRRRPVPRRRRNDPHPATSSRPRGAPRPTSRWRR